MENDDLEEERKMKEILQLILSFDGRFLKEVEKKREGLC